jgi:triacylglycerol lipase
MAKSDILAVARADLQATLRKAAELFAQVNPISAEAAANLPTWRAAYSDRTSALMASFCALAYDNFEDPTGVALADLRSKLEQAQFRLVNVYDVNACTQAFLAVSDQFAVLAFRGTQDAADWKVNLNAGVQPLDPAYPAIKVHRGFLEAFRSVETLIRADIDLHVPGDLGLYITGHSLGGGLAQIASAAFARDNLAACYTFGSPRVGDVRFDAEVSCPHYRVVNAWDLVPGVPPPFYLGYRHGGDVRTLRALGERPLRRNRPMVEGVFKTIAALFAYAFIRRLFIIDQHMIWNYSAKLEALLRPQRTAVDGETLERVMDEPEITVRFEAAIYAASRNFRADLDGGCEAALKQMAKAAAKSVAKVEQSPRDRFKSVLDGEQAFQKLIKEAGKTPPKRPPGVIDKEALGRATASLGRHPPYW